MSDEARKKRHPIRSVRILVQLLFLLLFVGLLIMTARHSWLLDHPNLSKIFLITDPLILISTLLAGSFIPILLLSLAVVVLVALFPRVYCGWVCPLGTTMDVFDRLFFRRLDRSKNTGLPLRKIKYCLLVLVLVLAVFGTGVVGWFDPISIATRTYATVVLPIVDLAAKAGLVPAARAGHQWAQNLLDLGTRGHLFFEDMELKEGATYVSYRFGWLFAVIMVGIVFAQVYQRRFWCRNVCPLGALLGIFSWLSPFRPRVGERCISCGKCQSACKTGAFQKLDAAQEKSKYRSVVHECIFCYECAKGMCPVDAIRISVGGLAKPAEGVMPSRRAFLGTLVAGAVLGPAFVLDKRMREKAETAPRLRPPGALRPDSEFLSACIRCGQCVRVCPKNALQPSGIENGIGGLWTPHFEFNIGPCDYWCGVSFEDVEADPEKTANLCGLVCPTGAIQKLTQSQKSTWRIGTAFIDRSRCIPWNEGAECRVCEEKCPVHAIGREGIKPFVRQNRCIGCGMCENVCPIEGPSAIQVFPRQTESAFDSASGAGGGFRGGGLP